MTLTDTIENTQRHTHEVIAISQYDQVMDAARLMYEHRIGCLVVTVDETDETMVGIVSERDILAWISNASPNTYFQKVRTIMTRKVVTSRPEAPLNESIEKMKQNHIRHMPTVVDGKAVGMLSVRDLLQRDIIV